MLSSMIHNYPLYSTKDMGVVVDAANWVSWVGSKLYEEFRFAFSGILYPLPNSCLLHAVKPVVVPKDASIQTLINVFGVPNKSCSFENSPKLWNSREKQIELCSRGRYIDFSTIFDFHANPSLFYNRYDRKFEKLERLFLKHGLSFDLDAEELYNYDTEYLVYLPVDDIKEVGKRYFEVEVQNVDENLESTYEKRLIAVEDESVIHMPLRPSL